MEFEEVALNTIKKMNYLDIPYMVTGALAVNYYGEPRTTHDIDLVLQIDRSDITKIMNIFKEDFFIDEESIEIALQEKSMFNIIHKEMGIKVDFWILKEDEFSKEEFYRRTKVKVIGTEMWMPTPEDMIIKKLDWYKSSDIDKHFFDALGIYRIQKDNLDLNYINKWVDKKSTSSIWKKIQERR